MFFFWNKEQRKKNITIDSLKINCTKVK